MRPSRRNKRSAVKLADSLNRRLHSYGIAASAASVSLLALAQPAEAEVVYTSAHIGLKPGAFYVLDLNNDGIGDFRFGNLAFSSFGVFYVEPWASFNSEQAHSTALVYPLALNRGAHIGPSQFFYGTNGGPSFNQIMAFAGAPGDVGNWANVRNRYLGLKFQINGETHYGWARLTVRVEGITIEAELTGYAYETVAGHALRAGQTSGTVAADSAPPQPRAGHLGALAKGAAR